MAISRLVVFFLFVTATISVAACNSPSAPSGANPYYQASNAAGSIVQLDGTVIPVAAGLITITVDSGTLIPTEGTSVTGGVMGFQKPIHISVDAKTPLSAGDSSWYFNLNCADANGGLIGTISGSGFNCGGNTFTTPFAPGSSGDTAMIEWLWGKQLPPSIPNIVILPTLSHARAVNVVFPLIPAWK